MQNNELEQEYADENNKEVHLAAIAYNFGYTETGKPSLAEHIADKSSDGTMQEDEAQEMLNNENFVINYALGYELAQEDLKDEATGKNKAGERFSYYMGVRAGVIAEKEDLEKLREDYIGTAVNNYPNKFNRKRNEQIYNLGFQEGLDYDGIQEHDDSVIGSEPGSRKQSYSEDNIYN